MTTPLGEQDGRDNSHIHLYVNSPSKRFFADMRLAHAFLSVVMYGRPPVGKSFLMLWQTCRGAVMYTAFACGR